MSLIPCYYINLDRSTERASGFKNECTRVSITPTRFAAIDGDSLSDNDANSLLSLTSGKVMMGKNELCCYLSHEQLWAQIIETQIAWAFIAEDDIHFSDDAALFFDNTDWLPQDADIVKAETYKNRIHMSSKVHSRIHGHDIRRLISRHLGTGGYFISRSGAEKLLHLMKEKYDPVDRILFDPEYDIMPQLCIYQIDQAICIQDFLVKKTQRFGYESTLLNERDSLVKEYSGSDQNILKHQRALNIKNERPKVIKLIWREAKRLIIRKTIIPLANMFYFFLGLIMNRKIKQITTKEYRF